MPKSEDEQSRLVDAWAFPAVVNGYAYKGYWYALRQGWISKGTKLERKLFNQQYTSGRTGNCYQLTYDFDRNRSFIIKVEQLADDNYLDIGVKASINLLSDNLGVLVDFSLYPYSKYPSVQDMTLLLVLQDGRANKRLTLSRQKNNVDLKMDIATPFGTLHKQTIYIPNCNQPLVEEMLQEMYSSQQLVMALNPKTAGHLVRGLTMGTLAETLAEKSQEEALTIIGNVISK